MNRAFATGSKQPRHKTGDAGVSANIELFK
jgi:hypothetical protein